MLNILPNPSYQQPGKTQMHAYKQNQNMYKCDKYVLCTHPNTVKTYQQQLLRGHATRYPHDKRAIHTACKPRIAPQHALSSMHSLPCTLSHSLLRQYQVAERHGLYVVAAHPAVATPTDPILSRKRLENGDVERQLMLLAPTFPGSD